MQQKPYTYQIFNVVLNPYRTNQVWVCTWGNGLLQGISQDGTTTSLGVSAASTAYGQPVTLTATVSPLDAGIGTPTGIVSFEDGTSILGTAPLDGSGTAIYSTSALAVGNHSITAAYGGDTNFVTSNSSAKNEFVYTLLGDANLDGTTDGADLNIVLSNYNKTDPGGMVGWQKGDFNGDGVVDGSD